MTQLSFSVPEHIAYAIEAEAKKSGSSGLLGVIF
jgi:hypothetical protein